MGGCIAVHIQRHIHHTHAGDLGDINRGIAAQPGKIGDGDLIYRLYIARKQGGDAPGIIWNDAELHFFKFRPWAEPIWVAAHGDEFAEAVIHQRIGAGEYPRLASVEVSGLEIITERCGDDGDFREVFCHEGIGFGGFYQ